MDRVDYKTTHEKFLGKLTEEQKKEYDQGYRDLIASELVLSVKKLKKEHRKIEKLAALLSKLLPKDA